MIVDEAEAAKLWCPMAMQALSRGPSLSSYNRAGSEPEPKCKGSACMFWEWKWEFQEGGQPKGEGWERTRSGDWRRRLDVGGCGMVAPRSAISML